MTWVFYLSIMSCLRDFTALLYVDLTSALVFAFGGETWPLRTCVCVAQTGCFVSASCRIKKAPISGADRYTGTVRGTVVDWCCPREVRLISRTAIAAFNV